MSHDLTDAWNINNRIHLYLLEGIPETSLTADMGGKGRNVFALFAHFHNVRLMWLKAAAPDLFADLSKIEPKPIGTKADISEALIASGQAIAELVERSVTGDQKIKGFKPNVTAFTAYLISHESHHRGQVEWALRLSGVPLDDKVSFGLWEWGTR